MTKLSAHQKLLGKDTLPTQKEAPQKWGGGSMLIPHPQDVLRLMRSIRTGQLTTANHLRQVLAESYGLDICCPLVTGIFVNVVASAAEEDRSAGKARPTPYWRTLKADFELNPKYPGGLEAHQALLEAEGHHVIAKGKRRFVSNAIDVSQAPARLKETRTLHKP